MGFYRAGARFIFSSLPLLGESMRGGKNIRHMIKLYIFRFYKYKRVTVVSDSISNAYMALTKDMRRDVKGTTVRKVLVALPGYE